MTTEREYQPFKPPTGFVLQHTARPSSQEGPLDVPPTGTITVTGDQLQPFVRSLLEDAIEARDLDLEVA
ncbi:MAG: hypothetical protein R3185_07245, partial [Candidatus Thermoplasmatota archaeon]|nr:hypothetical protein [Candidatus Thermoplasmatota archaeon]